MDAKFQDMTIAPMHSCEHILNQTMVNMFGCERSRNAHIERKKSKINYLLPKEPTEAEITKIENTVNSVILRDLSVSYEWVDKTTVPEDIPLDKLPENTESVLRLVRIGDYDVCTCIGVHVEHTAQIGRFKITSTSFKDGQFRIVFKLLPILTEDGKE